MTIDVPERGVSVEDGQATAKPIGRRTVLAGAAWAVPAIAVATAAPAHAASGLILAFDKTSYTAVGCATLTGVTVSVKNGSVPVPAAPVSVVLPNGFSFTSGGSSVSGTTDAQGVYALPDINVPNSQSTVTLSAVSGTLNASAALSVRANSSAARALNGTQDQQYNNVPAGSISIGSDYFLTPTNDLWFENTLVVSGVVAVNAWYFQSGSGDQWADYLLPNGTMRRAVRNNPNNYQYSGLPASARPVGQAYFLTDDGVLYHYGNRVTGHVKSVVTWWDGNHHADIELTSGVLIRTTNEVIDRTFSPLPASAKPIGADYFLSTDGDLFFRTDFVTAQVTSAVGWFFFGGSFFADYMTDYGLAARAWEKNNPRHRVYTGTPAGARALGTQYYLTNEGVLYWGDGIRALDGVDKAIAWAAGTQMTCDVRTKSGSCVRLYNEVMESQWSPMPENAKSIGASYYFDSDRQEVYYRGKLLVTGVISAAGYHIPNGGDFCDYTTIEGETIRAFYDNKREWVRQNVPAGSTAIGSYYNLSDGVLYYADNGAVVRGVASAVSWYNGSASADVQLESGAIVQVTNGVVTDTFSPMPQDAAAVGADYFLTPGGELYWQGKFVAGHVTAAEGYYFQGWGHQVCDYVTRDGVAWQAGDARPADRKITSPKYAQPLSRGYFLTEDGSLYFYDQPVRFGDGTPVTYDVFVPWSDQSYQHAEIRTPDGKLYRLIGSAVQYQYWQSSGAPQGTVPVGIYYFLTPQGNLYFSIANDPPVLLATGVTEAVGWYDPTRTYACVDYRDSNGVARRIDAGNPTLTVAYTNAPAGATLLGSGYFRTSSNDLWFADRDTQAMTKVATNPSSFDTWTGFDQNGASFFATFRPATGEPLRVRASAVLTPTEWRAGDAPLGAKLIGARYTLSQTGNLYVGGALVTSGVTDAVGWAWPADGSFNADYFASGIATRARGNVASFATYPGVLPTDKLLGQGYQLSGTDLRFRGAVVTQNVVGAAAWVDGGGNPFCDYRTSSLGAQRIQRPSGVIENWSPNSLTPVGSEPRGADYFVSPDGVLSFQGQLVDTGVIDSVGWNWGGDRYADYRKSGSPATTRIQAKGTVKTPYASEAVGTISIGSGHWFNTGTGELWYRNSSIATGIVSALGWTYGNPAVNYRNTAGVTRRREANVSPPVTTFTEGTTPLASTPLGAEYFLKGTDLYFRTGFSTGDVDRAIGYFVAGAGQYADYVTTTGEAFALSAGQPTVIDYTGTPESAIPVGAGYFHVTGGKLYHNGQAIKDAQGNDLGNVATAYGWAWSGSARAGSYTLIKDC